MGASAMAPAVLRYPVASNTGSTLPNYRKPGGFHLVPGGKSLTGARAYEHASGFVL